LLVVFALVALGPWPPARAETPDLRKAREHYRLGKEAYAADRFDDAYREFETGYRLSNRPLFLLNMGHARRRRGDLSEARALYKRFLFLQPDSPYRAEVEALLGQIEEPQRPPEASPPPVRVVPVTIPAAAAAPPMVATVVPPAPPPARTRWWLWAGAAVVAAVVVGVVARGGDSYTRQGSLGTLGAP
jgi:tetratricopeptide (TPR) repeat protein